MRYYRFEVTSYPLVISNPYMWIKLNPFIKISSNKKNFNFPPPFKSFKIKKLPLQIPLSKPQKKRTLNTQQKTRKGLRITKCDWTTHNQNKVAEENKYEHGFALDFSPFFVCPKNIIFSRKPLPLIIIIINEEN